MDRDWLAEWRVSVTAEVARLLETFPGEAWPSWGGARLAS